jgi:microcompartment protein CcmK/EutM
MNDVLQNPSTLTPLALLGLVVVQVAQLFRGHMDAKAGREAKIDDSLASILQRVMDQHAAASERHAVAMDKVGAALSEVQAHMRDTNNVLSTFSHRLEAVERQLAAGQAAPLPPIKLPTGRARAKAD